MRGVVVFFRPLQYRRALMIEPISVFDPLPARVHIFGAGMAGLAAAVRCLELGLQVSLHESAKHAGGRCRSLYDDKIGRLIDNGNHLVLGGNPSLFEYLRTIGSNHLLEPGDISFPFVDLGTDETWTLRPGSAKVPLWLLMPWRRVPGTSFNDYKLMQELTTLPEDHFLGELVEPGTPIFERFWEPLCAAVLNTAAEEGSAKLIGQMLERTMLRGPMFARPFFMPEGLSASLVEPALSYIQERQGEVSFSSRIAALNLKDDQVIGFEVVGAETELMENEAVILALPPREVSLLVPEQIVPTEFRPIVNVHFRVDEGVTLPDGVPFLGLIGGVGHWLFQRGDVISVTVSAATELAEQSAESIAEKIWAEVAKITSSGDLPVPPNRVIKEKRATIAQTPEQNRRRPDSATRWKNLFLAGDWTNTDLPATIEGAVRSGQKAAEFLGAWNTTLINR
jgi:squalene-associated FAD-dependent desaturase